MDYYVIITNAVEKPSDTLASDETHRYHLVQRPGAPAEPHFKMKVLGEVALRPDDVERESSKRGAGYAVAGFVLGLATGVISSK